MAKGAGKGNYNERQRLLSGDMESGSRGAVLAREFTANDKDAFNHFLEKKRKGADEVIQILKTTSGGNLLLEGTESLSSSQAINTILKNKSEIFRTLEKGQDLFALVKEAQISEEIKPLKAYLKISTKDFQKELKPPTLNVYLIIAIATIASLLQALPYIKGSEAGADDEPEGPLGLFGLWNAKPADEFITPIVSLLFNLILGAWFFAAYLLNTKDSIYDSMHANDFSNDLLQAWFFFKPERKRSLPSKFGHSFFEFIMSLSGTLLFGIVTFDFSLFTAFLTLNMAYTFITAVVIFGMMFAGGKVVEQVLKWPVNKLKDLILPHSTKNWKEYYIALNAIKVIQKDTVSRLENELLKIKKAIALDNQKNLEKLYTRLDINKEPADGLDFLSIGASLFEKLGKETPRQRFVRYIDNTGKGLAVISSVELQSASLVGYGLLQENTIEEPIAKLPVPEHVVIGVSYGLGGITFLPFLFVSYKSSIGASLDFYRTGKQFVRGSVNKVYCLIKHIEQTEPVFLMSAALKKNKLFLIPVAGSLVTGWNSAGTADGLNAALITQECVKRWGVEEGTKIAQKFFNSPWGKALAWTATAGTAFFNVFYFPVLMKIIAEWYVTVNFVHDDVDQVKKDIRLERAYEKQIKFHKEASPKQYIEISAGFDTVNKETRINKFSPFFGGNTAQSLIEKIGKEKLTAMGLNPDNYPEGLNSNEESLLNLIHDIERKFLEYDERVHPSEHTDAPKKSSSCWPKLLWWGSKNQTKPSPDSFTNQTRRPRPGSRGNSDGEQQPLVPTNTIATERDEKNIYTPSTEYN